MAELTDIQLREFIYDIVTKKLCGDMYRDIEDGYPYQFDAKGFRRHIKRRMRGSADRLHADIEKAVNGKHHHQVYGWVTLSGYTWRDIPIKPHKFKACKVCGRIFYDCSRNGRVITCRYIPYERYNKKTYRYEKAFHKDGRYKSLCYMEWEARKERRRYNLKRYGVDSFEKRGIAERNRYSVPRVRKTVYGVPIDAPRTPEEKRLIEQYKTNQRIKKQAWESWNRRKYGDI